MRLKSLIIIFLPGLLALASVQAMFIPDVSQQAVLPFLTFTEAKKKQINELEILLSTTKKRAEEFNQTASLSLKKINSELVEIKNKLLSATISESDRLNKKTTLLNDRKQNLEATLELWDDTLKKLEQHIKLIKDFLTDSKSTNPQYKIVYTWKEFRDAQLKTTEAFHKIEQEKNKNELLKKQRSAENETVDSLLKQVEVKNKERDKILSHKETTSSGKVAPKKSTHILKVEGEILDQELSLLNEKIDYYKLKGDKLEREEKLKDDEIEFLQKKFDEQKAALGVIEKRLVLDAADVETAKIEWTNLTQKVTAIKDGLTSQEEPQKYEKEKLSLDFDYLSEKLKKYKEAKLKDYASSAVIKSELQKVSNQIAILDLKIKLVDAKKMLANFAVRDRELQFLMVELRYKLQTTPDKIDLDEEIVNFKNQKDLELSTLKAISDNRDKAIASLIESNRLIETLKAKELKLKNKKISFFKDRQAELQETIGNYRDAQKSLQIQLNIAQDYLAVNHDLILSQEKILNRLDLIVSDIETRLRLLSIWRRSPQAISFEALKRAMISGEVFFKRLFWQTPEHLAPSVIIKSIKGSTFNDYIMLLFATVFFLLAFWGLSSALLFARRKIIAVLELYQHHKRILYLNVIAAFINFAIEHFRLLFCWLFVYLHIIFSFKYIFASLRFLYSPYYLAMFYIISIPILVFLAHRFLDSLKRLNQKLSYLLFAEQFQNRFLILLTTVFYASAVLLPLRKAFLCYPDLSADFPVVILAAYSLMLVVVFLLLFSKDDVLKLIPSHTPFFIWLEKKIEYYYYPVFFFFMGLLILANSYVGYSNLAWFLIFAVPASASLFYLLFITHNYIRKHAVYIFMEEEDEDISDKFEHAKTYYGFFVIFSFILLFFTTFFFIARIWGVEYSPSDIWKLLAESWVIPLGGGNNLGVIQFVMIILFVLAGFVLSSLVYKFVLNKLFEILRSEPGIQNTISRITHYTIIALAFTLGLAAIHLEQFIVSIAISLGIAIGWAGKDFVSDFIAGFIVLIERPIEIGNYIKLDSFEGTVHKIAARSTTIITSRNHSIVIPNKDLINKNIDNWSYSRFAVGFEVNIRVDLKSDPDLVKKTLLTVIQGNTAVLKVPNVVVRLEEIEADALYFLTRAFISSRRIKDQWTLAADLRTEIFKVFKANNIQFARPQRVVGFNFEGDRSEAQKPLEIKFGK